MYSDAFLKTNSTPTWRGAVTSRSVIGWALLLTSKVIRVHVPCPHPAQYD